MKLAETDMTLFFRKLANLDIDATIAAEDPIHELQSVFYEPASITAKQREQLNQWLRSYATLVKHQAQNPEQRIVRMNATNPLYVPRNYLAQLAIDEIEKGNLQYLEDWMSVLKSPYTEQPGKDSFAAKRPDWARTRVGCSMLSCSS